MRRSLVWVLLLVPAVGFGQAPPPKDYTDLRNQRDIIDLYNYVFRHDSSFTRVDSAKRPGQVYFALGGAAGYTQQTGFAIAGTVNFAFLTSGAPEQNLSTIFLSPTYTQRSQIYLPVQTSIWTRDNRYNIASDVRIIRNVQDTHGIGSGTTEATRYTVNYNYIRAHVVLFRALGHDHLLGAGVAADHYWRIEEVTPQRKTDFQRYGYTSAARSTGLLMEYLYDTRRNSLNPEGGALVNLTLRHTPLGLGNTTGWTSLTIDARLYRRLSVRSNNILALWSYNWFVLDGRPPYLDLPGTGMDASNNTGRGYATGRYRGLAMVDIEAEYRIQLTRNGLFGMVVFGSVQTLANRAYRFEALAPAAGLGLRMKFNKYSRANISLDYGFGLYGAQNLLLNVGEVF